MRRVTPEPFQALLNNLDTSAQEKNTKQTMSTYTEEETSFPSMAVAISLSLSSTAVVVCMPHRMGERTHLERFDSFADFIAARTIAGW